MQHMNPESSRESKKPVAAHDSCMMAEEADALWARIRWTADGLVPAIAQDAQTGEVLMMAWMNRESLKLTLETGRAVYFSRSRKSLWRKGDTSGHTQTVLEMRVDCDADCLLLKVHQTGAACHTGRRSCFYRTVSQKGCFLEGEGDE
jgi:phosphoribosyl-AMP cyclohydrolase